MEKPSLRRIISTENPGRTSQRKIFHIAPSVLLSWPFISSLDSTLKHHPTSSASLYTVKCIIPPQVQHTNAAGGTREWTVALTWWRLRTRRFCCMKAAITHRPTLYHFWWESNQNKCGGTLSRREESTLCLQQTNNWSHWCPSASVTAGL